MLGLFDAIFVWENVAIGKAIIIITIADSSFCLFIPFVFNEYFINGLILIELLFFFLEVNGKITQLKKMLNKEKKTDLKVSLFF
jgi:hypothetical protein